MPLMVTLRDGANEAPYDLKKLHGDTVTRYKEKEEHRSEHVESLEQRESATLCLCYVYWQT